MSADQRQGSREQDLAETKRQIAGLAGSGRQEERRAGGLRIKASPFNQQVSEGSIDWAVPDRCSGD